MTCPSLGVRSRPKPCGGGRTTVASCAPASGAAGGVFDGQIASKHAPENAAVSGMGAPPRRERVRFEMGSGARSTWDRAREEVRFARHARCARCGAQPGRAGSGKIRTRGAGSRSRARRTVSRQWTWAASAVVPRPTGVVDSSETGPSFNLTDWVRHHDRYDDDGFVDPTGRHRPKGADSSCDAYEDQPEGGRTQ